MRFCGIWKIFVNNETSTILLSRTAAGKLDLSVDTNNPAAPPQPFMKWDILMHNGKDYCYRLARTFAAHFGSMLINKRACEERYTRALVLETHPEKVEAVDLEWYHTCGCDDDDTMQLASVLDKTPSSPYLLRDLDANRVQLPKEIVERHCNSIKAQNDSLHDEALDLLSIADPPGFAIDEDYYFSVTHTEADDEIIESGDELLKNGTVVSKRETRLLCIVYTMESHHDSHLPYLLESWPGRCSGFLVFSTVAHPTMPHTIISIPHEGEESYDNLWLKIVSIWTYVHDHYMNEFDYFYICGDDTFMIVGNMRGFLHQNEVVKERRRSRTGLYLGRQFKVDSQHHFTGTTFNSGGPGYVLDGTALHALVARGFREHPEECQVHKQTSAEDTHLASCLRFFGIHPIDSRDVLLRNRFHHKDPHVTYAATEHDFDWFMQNSMQPVIMGALGISDTSIAFHWVKAHSLNALDFYVMQCLYWPSIVP